MDLQKTAREIGLFETAVNLAKVSSSTDVIQKAGASMPLPSEKVTVRSKHVAEWLLSFGKSKYMFLVPEIILIEQMGKLSAGDIEVIIAVPCDLDTEAKERLRNNLPNGVVVKVLEEPYFPQSFFPANGMIVISGYLGGDRAMVLPDTYRMIEHYNGFLGKKVFVPYKELDAPARYDRWMEIKHKRLDAVWRCKNG